MKHALLKRLKKTDHLPMLFIGSGMSIRYLGLENWKGQLRRFAQLTTENEYAYEMYEQQAKGLECKEGLLPKVAELIERDFNVRWFKDEQFRDNRGLSADEIGRSVSPFKIEISRYMRDQSRVKEICLRKSNLQITKKNLMTFFPIRLGKIEINIHAGKTR